MRKNSENIYESPGDSNKFPHFSEDNSFMLGSNDKLKVPQTQRHNIDEEERNDLDKTPLANNDSENIRFSMPMQPNQ